MTAVAAASSSCAVSLHRSTPARATVIGLARLLVVLMVASMVAAGCSQDPPPESADADPGLVHVHGMGVNPSNGVLYAATHTGLFKLEDGRPATRVSTRLQDTMGFTVAGPDHFLGSGHPDLRDTELQRPDRPPLLGLVESRDAGHTWRSLSLLGEADFHALASVHGRVYGYDVTSGRFMVTTDRRRWEPRSVVALVTFAVSPRQPALVVGASERGVVRSVDQGRRWTQPSGPVLRALAWEETDALWGAGVDGQLYLSQDQGRTWAPRGRLGGEPEALVAHGGRLHVALHGKGVYQSQDGGRSWRLSHGAD
jgi:hypothetical protein